MKKTCDSLGLTDDSKLLTYEQFVDISTDRLDIIKEKFISYGWPEMFQIIDVNNNGFISLKEWTDHVRAILEQGKRMLKLHLLLWIPMNMVKYQWMSLLRTAVSISFLPRTSSIAPFCLDHWSEKEN